MNREMSKEYIVSRHGLSLLFLAAGKKSICSYALTDGNRITDRDYVKSIHVLVRDGMMKLEKNDTGHIRAVITDSCADYIRPCVEAERIVRIIPADENEQEMLMYFAKDEVTVSAPDARNEDNIILGMLNIHNLGEYLTDRFDLEPYMPGDGLKAERYALGSKSGILEKSDLEAIESPDGMDVKDWIRECGESTDTEPVFAAIYMSPYDGGVTAHALLTRGKLTDWWAFSLAGAQKSDVNVRAVFPGMWEGVF
jgi:hypothetical protein